MTDQNLKIGYILASNLVAKERKKVGFLYREEPDNAQDSGWRVFSGDEDQEYADDAAHFDLYNASTIVEIDPSIEPLLSSPTFTAFERAENGTDFVRVDDFDFGKDLE